MPTKKMMYSCNVCGRGYGTEKAAKGCESSHTLYTAVSVFDKDSKVVVSEDLVKGPDDEYFLQPTYIRDSKKKKFKWTMLVKDPTKEVIAMTALRVLDKAIMTVRGDVESISDSITAIEAEISSREQDRKEEMQTLCALNAQLRELQDERRKYQQGADDD